jgi:hypothetical protein
MKFRTLLLEEWMRLYYFGAEVDIGSSGVQNLSSLGTANRSAARRCGRLWPTAGWMGAAIMCW